MSDDPYENLPDKQRQVFEFLKALTQEALFTHQEAIDKGVLPGTGKKGVVFMVGEMQNPDPTDALRVAIACGSCHAIQVMGYAPNEESVRTLLTGTDEAWTTVKEFQAKHASCPMTIGADYSPLERRVMEQGAVEAHPVNQIPTSRIEEGKDIHRTRAAEMFGIPEDQVTLAQRADAKARYFNELYARDPQELQKALRGDSDDS